MFNTTANLLTPDGPTGFPGDAWARENITVRSTDRNVWQEAGYSAPSGSPRDDKGENDVNVPLNMYRSLSDVEISITTFGGDPIERYQIDGDWCPPTGAPGSPTPTRPSSRARRFRSSTAG